MSRHIATLPHRGGVVSVLLGWDRPLHEHFFSVTWIDAPRDVINAATVARDTGDEDDEGDENDFDLTIYNTIEGHPGGSPENQLVTFRAVLTKEGIDPTSGVVKLMFKFVEEDRIGNVGNRIVKYDGETGTVTDMRL